MLLIALDALDRYTVIGVVKILTIVSSRKKLTSAKIIEIIEFCTYHSEIVKY